MPTEFRNEPFTDFTKEENAQAMRDGARESSRASLGASIRSSSAAKELLPVTCSTVSIPPIAHR